LGRAAMLLVPGRFSSELAEPAAGEQVVDRADQILDVYNENGPAIFEHRRAVEVGYLAEPGIQRRDAEVALTQESVDDHAESVAAIAGDHHGQELSGALALVGQLEHARRLDQAHELIVQQAVGLTLEVADLLAVEHQDAVDPVERKRVRLARDLDQQ